jgi:hypothetical protein
VSERENLDKYRGMVRVATFDLYLHGDGAVSVIADPHSPIKPEFVLRLHETEASDPRKLAVDIRLPFIPISAKVHPEVRDDS